MFVLCAAVGLPALLARMIESESAFEIVLSAGATFFMFVLRAAVVLAALATLIACALPRGLMTLIASSCLIHRKETETEQTQKYS